MLWNQYVFRKGTASVQQLWDKFFDNRSIRMLYIAGGGFDVRAQRSIAELVSSVKDFGNRLDYAQLILIDLSDYELAAELVTLTENNIQQLEATFSQIGNVQHVALGGSHDGDEEVSASMALRIGIQNIHECIGEVTDIIIDISSLPRVIYLALITSLLERFVSNDDGESGRHRLFASGLNIQLVVAEDAALDAVIVAEDPSKDLIIIPGFSSALHAESVQDWPLVWFPVLGENRVGHMQILMDSATIPRSAEICPVIPHPSKEPRRGDRLVAEYREPLFDRLGTSTGNIMYTHESHPFEAYRQILGAMQRYKESMKLLGGCRLVVSPLGSKLITVGAGLACYEMKSTIAGEPCAVAISHAEPRRYVAPMEELQASNPELSAILLTGIAYS